MAMALEEATPAPTTQRTSNTLQEWFGWRINSELDYSRLARQGVSPDVVIKLQAHGFKRGELQWVIASRTLSHRAKKGESLTRDESAKAIRVARLTAQAETVFANPEKAHRWLSKPKRQLNGLSPKEAMQDEFGARLVDQMLKKIDNGFF
ncbi:antitoxin Xre/MbcA/ParS toxin-binding domain-containing protein [Marinobacter subterrani]|uniref:antitoxin Xre/MbcA/ParS toxin-binding domain-containing protein n=1 Tax=Marinobacter subterrani TaxID=1658765 RepID=UPI0023564F4C|nr:antitoxin Xre/MbcA/ParS toxin-binding domain-containing protein [Marinobacter subterrani]